MTTHDDLHNMAKVIDLNGLHRGGNNFAQPGLIPRLDISAIAYVIAEHLTPDRYPAVFFTNDVASVALIESSDRAMTLIRAISAALDSEPCDTDGVPDYIEHISNWTATRAPFSSAPPTDSEVIGRIRRAADHARQTTNPHAA
ncbi:hypothetical protein DMH12_36190 [Streptomyces sp. WAC 04229]|uniref:hypothetical protein n=1 Tax=Streptomyces sp. WAC 04229 TaxID=2203206 RepID=UPI000F741DE0|nr:hypothetical protein [Streptomyces sp. WAC 04229]RSN39997.1 hypothetical protein DMH12_36190 [Streptomyces sp. WAC 04229]